MVCGSRDDPEQPACGDCERGNRGHGWRALVLVSPERCRMVKSVQERLGS